jgi:hypothetical protein
LITPSDPTQSSSSYVPVCIPERQSGPSFDAQRPCSMEALVGQSSSTFHGPSLSQGLVWMDQHDSSSSHTGGGTDDRSVRPSLGTDRPCRTEVDGMNVNVHDNTPTSFHIQQSTNCDLNDLFRSSRKHLHSSLQENHHSPSFFMETSKDRPSLHIDIEDTERPFIELYRLSVPVHTLPSAYPTMVTTAPTPLTPNIEADMLEPEDPPELRCEVDGCDASFSGEYRNGNLGRHRRQKHRDLKSYDCENEACDKTFSRQDARLKHYRASHPGLASSHIARKPDRITCPEGCHATFGRIGELRRHMIKHQPPRYKCPILDCDQTFHRVDKLRDHTRNGHGGRNELNLP